MSDSATPIDISTGAAAATNTKDETLTEVARDAAVATSSKGKRKAPEPKTDVVQDCEKDNDDEDDDEEEDEDEDEDDEDDLSIEPDEVDPQNINSYGIGNRPSRKRKPIDYSSEEAFKKAGFIAEVGDDEEDDRDFNADVSMDV